MRLLWVAAAVTLAMLRVEASCQSNLCNQGATCVPSDSGYTCSCPRAWVGTYCNITAQCDATAFNQFAPAAAIPGATYPSSIGARSIVATSRYVFTPQQWRQDVGLAHTYLAVSRSTPLTSPFNTQQFYQTLTDVDLYGNNVFSATDSLLALASGGDDRALLYTVAKNGSWTPFKSMSPHTEGNIRVTGIAQNDDWLVLFTGNPVDGHGLLSAEFYNTVNTADGHGGIIHTVTYNMTVTPSLPALPVQVVMTPSVCADQFVAVAIEVGTPGAPIGIIYHLNASAGTWNATQFITLAGFSQATVAMSCELLVWAQPTDSNNNLWYSYRQEGSSIDPWPAPARFRVPDTVSGEQCGASAAADSYDGTLVLGCPLSDPGYGDVGRVVEFITYPNGTLAYTRQFNNYCSSTYTKGSDIKFGSSVAQANGQLFVGAPGYNSGFGVLMQYGEQCGAQGSVCIEGNTCVRSPFGAQKMCVCTVSPSPCTLSSSAAASTITFSGAPAAGFVFATMVLGAWMLRLTQLAA